MQYGFVLCGSNQVLMESIKITGERLHLFIRPQDQLVKIDWR